MTPITFDQLASLPTLGRFYRLGWRIFGVNIVLVGPSGSPRLRMSPVGATSSFCRAAWDNIPGLKAHCAECDRRHFEIAKQQARTLRYHCYLGLTEFVIPVILDSEIIALLQCGQILDAEPKKKDWLRTREVLAAFSASSDVLEPLYYKIRVIHPKAQKDLVALLQLFGNYIAHAQNQLLLLEEARSSELVAHSELYIRNHFKQPIALRDIAELTHTSTRNLTRVFVQEAGHSVLDFIQETRIAYACSRLVSTRSTCAQIAFESGFGSVQQFNRVFKRFKGEPPSAWRKRHEQKET